jgi:HAE1 family hydrophobic/amphiphilic exporter-1
MLPRLTQASIANRAVVLLLTVLVVAGGLFSLSSLRQELFPDFASPESTVVTAVPGASPEVVDRRVTLPLSRALEQVAGVDSVTATSSSGVSVISLATDYNLDQDELAADIDAAIGSAAAELPSNAAPEYANGGVDDLPAMTLTVSSDLPAPELRQRLTATAIPELRGVPGVQDVTVSGGTTRRVTVTPNAGQLAARGLSTDSISQALTENGTTLPVGSIVQAGEIVGVQVGAALASVEDIGNLPLLPAAGQGSPTAEPGGPSASAAGRGGRVLLGHVAKVTVTDDPATSVTRVNGEPAVSVQILATGEADLVSLSRDVNDVLADIEADLGHNSEIVVASDQAPYISESLNHLAIEGGLGLLFAVLVILLFLRSARPTVVTAISIPLSILVTFVGLYLRDYSLNMLTLGALTIAIGRVVDDSIVVIENVKRHMGYGERKVEAILDGTREVASAITGSTLATVLVFVPITLVGGFVGQLFRPFALTVTIAMLASLVIALTIVPVLSYWFLKEPDRGPAGVRASPETPPADEDDEPNLLQRHYVPVLRWTMRKPLAVLVPAVVLLGGSLALTPRLGVEFLGDTGETTISVSQTFDSSLAVDEVTARIAGVEDVMRGVSGVTDVVVTASLAGSGESSGTGGGPGDETTGDTTATYTVATASDADPSAVAGDLEDVLARLPEADSIAVGDSSSSAGGESVDVAITSSDESALDDAATRVVQALADVPHTTEISNDLAADKATFRVEVDRPKAATYGLTEQTVTGNVAAAMSPEAVTDVTIGGSRFPVYVAGPTVTTEAELKALPLTGGSQALKLGDVATVQEVSGPAGFSRSGTDLVATVSLTPESGELGSVQSAIESRLDTLDLPDGVTVSIGGVAEQQSDAFTQLGLSMLVAVGLIFILLVGTLRSMVQPFILMVSIPFAAIGAISLLFVTGTPLGVAAMIGLLMLIGIVVTNAIVLMDLINQYRRRGLTVRDAILLGAGRRVRPIVMTALATICALMPMATGITGGSGFISRGLAIVVIGGLVSSTALTLLIVPAIYQLVEGRQERRGERRRARRMDRPSPAETAPTVSASAGGDHRGP